jgi:D-glycero-alpha-D-manno-heptose-7-phosphate kinase
VGAGGGGFHMLYTEEPERLRTALTQAKLEELRFHFDFDGPTVIARN